MGAIPIWVVFLFTGLLVIGVLEIAYRLGRHTHRRFPDEKESPVHASAAAILGLLAFMLGFTFDIASERFQRRRATVRDEVAALQTAYLRSDLLPEPHRTESKAMLQRYVASILATPPREGRPPADIQVKVLARNEGAWREVRVIDGAHLDTNLGAGYIAAISELDALALRRAMLERPAIGSLAWGALYGLTILAVLGIGYQVGVAGSKRSKVGFCLAGSFAVVIALIADLDRVAGFIQVSQEPFRILQEAFAAGTTTAAH
jgi:hypothetical protein